MSAATPPKFHVLPILACLVWLGCQKPAPPPAPAASTGTVIVEIESGGQTETIQIPNVAAGTTLESLMRSIDQVPISIRGSGQTAFVDAIGGQSTSPGKGWTFQVNGEFANQGVGSTTVTPPATIRWSFGDASETMER